MKSSTPPDDHRTAAEVPRNSGHPPLTAFTGICDVSVLAYVPQSEPEPTSPEAVRRGRYGRVGCGQRRSLSAVMGRLRMRMPVAWWTALAMAAAAPTMVPWSRVPGISRPRRSWLVLELYRCQPSESAVPAPAVVPDLEVLEHRVRQLDPGPPPLPVEQLDLHPRAERLDHGVVEAVRDAAHRRRQPGRLGPVGERPGAELHAPVGVDHGPGWWCAGVDRHAEGVRRLRG